MNYFNGTKREKLIPLIGAQVQVMLDIGGSPILATICNVKSIFGVPRYQVSVPLAHPPTLWISGWIRSERFQPFPTGEVFRLSHLEEAVTVVED